MRNDCCCHDPSSVAVTGRSWTRAVRQVVSWIVPSIVLAALPKCPVCLAAYVTLFTGYSISLAAASSARWLIAAGCIGILLCLGVKALLDLRRTTRHQG